MSKSALTSSFFRTAVLLAAGLAVVPTLALPPLDPPEGTLSPSGDQGGETLSARGQELPPIGIGIVLDGPTATELSDPADPSGMTMTDLSQQTMDEIEVLLEDEFDVRFRRRAGQWSVASVQVEIEAMLADPEIDLLVALGPIASQIFCCRQELPKPVIAAVVIDARLQGLPRAESGSGLRNLNYLTFPMSVESDIAQFRAIVPFRKLAIVFNKWFTASVPGLHENVGALVENLGVEAILVEVGQSVEEVVAAIPADAEAVYAAPLLQLTVEDRRRFYDLLIERRLPSFAIFGVLDVLRGALAGQRDITFYQRLSRRIALNTQRIVLGDAPESLPVTIPDRQLLTINMDTVRRLDSYPPWTVLAEADLINEDPEFERTLSLDGVVKEAIEVNLDLLARRREVLAGAQDVARARSALRPRAEISATGVLIDDDRAASIFSPQAERTLTGSATLRQLLYSEPVRANVEIERQLQRSREEALVELRIDIAQEAAIVYLDVLRAKTFERIRRDDLRLTRSNLELARVRQALGTAGPGEVFRWESELANDRRALIDAQATRYQAQEAMNRILHRWQAEGFDTKDVGLDDPALITSKEPIYAYTISPQHFDIFSNFSIEAGLERSPELARFDAVIAAQERGLKSARRAFVRPELALEISIDQTIEASGAGTDAIAGTDQLPFEITIPDTTSWSVAIAGSFPLFEGGARRAEVVQAEETLAQLRLEREALAERIEQRIRAELHQTRASYSGIGLSREAAAAAGKTLDVVTDAYSRGAADILDLLDAQSASLQAELAAAAALYQFFIDLIEFERAINRLDFFTTPQEDVAWFEELDVYFREAGVKPRPRRPEDVP